FRLWPRAVWWTDPVAMATAMRLAVEAGISMGWEQWVGAQGATITLDHFGASAPYEVLYEQFGFTPKNIAKVAMELLKR
ncbi:MAG TPA: hypothetical protein PK530_06965, partial [Anaerolineales bacterium]|nr:hypothetical protein [Anaerolineales bacterium]